jgi:hypothetical protein
LRSLSKIYNVHKRPADLTSFAALQSKMRWQLWPLALHLTDAATSTGEKFWEVPFCIHTEFLMFTRVFVHRKRGEIK